VGPRSAGVNAGGLALALLVAACGETQRDAGGDGAWVTATSDEGASTRGDATDDGADDATLDVGAGTGGPTLACEVDDDMDAPGACEDHAPPDSFAPATQWTWSGDEGEVHALVIPLVANLTDDDGNGSVDLCDVPDLVVVATAGGAGFPPGHVYILSGDDGHVHGRLPVVVDSWVTPALGDIDGDGVIEIVSVTPEGDFVAMTADGTLEWTGTARWEEPWGGAIALADLDGDGTAEILADNLVVSHEGELEWSVPGQAFALSATTAAELDGAPGLEVIMNSGAYHHDGTPWFELAAASGGFPQVADFDGDGAPELLFTTQSGISLYRGDGAPIFTDLQPFGSNQVGGEYQRPAAIHDFDGDGSIDFATSSALAFGVCRGDGSVLWQAPIVDQSGLAGGTGFDFLGDGSAEAMYGDEHDTHVFDSDGRELITAPRVSGTLMEYPVVADIDNDGSAEVVVINGVANGPNPRPTIEVIRDADDRWVGARRIWNQHTYHVTNVREDGTIPSDETPSWRYLDTFRTNAQQQADGVCVPPVG
jgi:FG-GAP-like repeat